MELSATPIYQMFDIIAQSGVGNLGNAGLIMLQMIISLFFESKFLLSVMKKRPPLVQISVSMIPLILIATYSMVCGLFFSAFLEKVPTPQEMTELVDITLTKQCTNEILIAVAVFFALMVIYSIAYKLNLLQWAATFGIEMLAALSLLALYGGLLIPDFPFTVLDLCDIDIYLSRWLIYGYFTLLFKCCVLVMCLILGFFLRERKEKQEAEEERYNDRQGYYERKTLRYLTKNDTLIGGALLLFSIAAEVLLWYVSKRDTDTVWDADTISSMVFATTLFAAPAVASVCLFFRALCPKTCKAYRQLLAMGNNDVVLQLFCEEIVDKKAQETNLLGSKTHIQTAHFTYWQQGVRPRVQWRGERLQQSSDWHESEIR